MLIIAIVARAAERARPLAAVLTADEIEAGEFFIMRMRDWTAI